LAEAREERAAFDHLINAGRDDVVIELEAQIVRERVDAIEPVIEAIEEIRIGAVRLQLLARDRVARGAGAIKH
jgi:hypothetical protein